MLNTSLAHQHAKVRRALGFPAEFVLHSLRHRFCTRLGEAGTEAFLIQRLAGHQSVTVSERYVHPTPESAVLAIRRLDAANTGPSAENQLALKLASHLGIACKSLLGR
jgi:integrase